MRLKSPASRLYKRIFRHRWIFVAWIFLSLLWIGHQARYLFHIKHNFVFNDLFIIGPALLAPVLSLLPLYVDTLVAKIVDGRTYRLLLCVWATSSLILIGLAAYGAACPIQCTMCMSAEYTDMLFTVILSLALLLFMETGLYTNMHVVKLTSGPTYKMILGGCILLAYGLCTYRYIHPPENIIYGGNTCFGPAAEERISKLTDIPEFFFLFPLAILLPTFMILAGIVLYTTRRIAVSFKPRPNDAP